MLIEGIAVIEKHEIILTEISGLRDIDHELQESFMRMKRVGYEGCFNGNGEVGAHKP